MISKDELLTLLKDLNSQITQAEVNKLFMAADADSDGGLNYKAIRDGCVGRPMGGASFFCFFVFLSERALQSTNSKFFPGMCPRGNLGTSLFLILLMFNYAQF